MGFNSETPREITYLSNGLLRVPERDSRFFRDPQLLRDLKASIKDCGVLVPLSVTPFEKTFFFTIIDGVSRYLASSKLQIRELPCIVYRGLTRAQYLILRGKLNIQRHSYEPVAVARDMWELANDFKMSYSEIGRAYNFSKGWVAQLMLLNRCSAESRLAVSRGELTIFDACQTQRDLERGDVAKRLHQIKPDEIHAPVVRCEGCARILEYFAQYQRPVLCRACVSTAFDAIKLKRKRPSKLPVKSSELYRTSRAHSGSRS